jgi:hypothetical protein
MINTNTETFNPCSNYTDDMPVYVRICDKPKKPKGRPTACKMSDEQKREKAKLIPRTYYADNHEYCLKRQFIYDEKNK